MRQLKQAWLRSVRSRAYANLAGRGPRPARTCAVAGFQRPKLLPAVAIFPPPKKPTILWIQTCALSQPGEQPKTRRARVFPIASGMLRTCHTRGIACGHMFVAEQRRPHIHVKNQYHSSIRSYAGVEKEVGCFPLTYH